MRKCSICKKYRKDYFTAYFHNLGKRLTICHVCLKKYAPIDYNQLKNEIEKIYLEVVANESS